MRAIAMAGLLLLAGFHQPASFEASASDGGGNRVYFDGSPRDKSYDCTACHTDAPRAITARVDVTPALSGAYQPGATYSVAVALVGEHAGFGTADNQNGFVAELVDDVAMPAGVLASADGTVQTIDDGNVVSGEGKDITMWTFTWTAPESGRGATTLYLGMVDGNGAASATVPENDPGGDDVAVVTMRLCESSPGCADRPAPVVTESKAAGCSAGGGASPWLVLAVLGVLRRRALLAIVLAGCFAPTTPGDCPDHVCGGSGGDDGTSCAESWTCSSWEAPAGSDQATRTCVDANNTGTTTCKPATTATLPALDLEAYKCRVHPIFQRGCGQLGCHGTDTGHAFRIYTRGRFRNNQLVDPVNTCLEDPNVKVNLQARGTGTVMCEGWSAHTAEEWNKSFDSARSFMIDVANPDDSLLLREAAKGGLPHAQVKLFGVGDPDYTTIRDWLAGASLGTTCNTGRN
jgi:hypothetical protein